MPSKRIPIHRRRRNIQISDEVIASYVAGDYHRLHGLLRLPPWHPSPLPLDVTPLGVDQEVPPAWENYPQLYVAAQALQREIEIAIDAKERKR